MPPRKSNVSQISATDPEGGGTPLKERDGINIEDLSLPRTMVQRLAKGVLPPNTSLHKDAILAMSKGATVFINYLAQAASTSTTNANKRTIPPPAVLEALVDLEFESFVPRVEAELQKFNEVQVGKRNEYRRKVKEGKMGEKGEAGRQGDVVGSSGDGEEGDEGARPNKRVRRESGDEGAGGGVGVNGGISGDGHEQLMVQDPYPNGEEAEEDEDEEEGPGGDGGGEEDADESLRQREVEEEEEGEEEEEEDDEDEYPDEGRRLSSVEREAHEGRSLRDEDSGGQGSSAEEEGGSEVSD